MAHEFFNAKERGDTLRAGLLMRCLTENGLTLFVY
jgi:hypothetical protein